MQHRNAIELVVVATFTLSACSVATIEPRADADPPDSARPDTGQPPPQDCPHDPDDFDYVCDASVDATPDAAVPDPVDSALPDSALPDSALPDGGPTADYCPHDYVPSPCDRCLVAPRAVDPCEGEPRMPAAAILEDTSWIGRRCIAGSITVANGATLTIEAGSEIYFAPFSTLLVRGHLAIAGTADDRVLLSADGLRPTSMSWEGISVEMYRGGTLAMEHATLEFSRQGVVTWEDGSRPTRAGPEVTVSVRHSELRYNNAAYYPDDNSELWRSSVWCNLSGVLIVSEDDPVIAHVGNNICHNLDGAAYAVQDGADMSGNYWCATDPAAIEAAIHDIRDPGGSYASGVVTFEPILTSPVPGAPAFPF